MSGRLLYTVGYEGAELSDFLATLKVHNIRQIIDVRELPLSRKRGFSKNALAAALQGLGIGYLHVKSLGDPKPGREAARSGDIALFRNIYTRHINAKDGQEGLITASNAARKARSSLLCYERDHVDCHRSIIANRLKDDFEIVHISVAPSVPKRRKIASDHHAGSVALG